MLLNHLLLSSIGKIVLILLISTMLSNGKGTDKKIPKRELDTKHSNTQKKIVLMHNFYRAKVDPPASNMLEMEWLAEAQDGAQQWAEKCKFSKHNRGVSRRVETLGSCGQNIFVSNIQVDWRQVIKSWYSEHKNFTYGSSANKLEEVGRYTQMVWYNSHKVGCGFYFCGKDKTKMPFYNYVCNYCPIGNSLKQLGKPYASGKPCSSCPKYCKYKKLCINSCPFTDDWVNCKDINLSWHAWLCDDQQKEEHCKATCRCFNAIR